MNHTVATALFEATPRRPLLRLAAGCAPGIPVRVARCVDVVHTLIDRAAQVTGKNRSEFMLDAACREATAVLLDRRLFDLDAKTYRAFLAALDKPTADNPRLRLLRSQAPWE